jgi:predicted AAA+ superfamily ATPase
MKYIERLCDKQISAYLKIFGAVLIEGLKWCGKTCSAKRQAASTFELADPNHNFQNRALAQMDMEHVLTGKKPRLIDEWQEVPAIWDGVRYRVDQVKSKGQYLLTGSSTPNDLAKIHSGAGRFGRVLLQTLTLQELGISTGKASLKKLLQGRFSPPRPASPGKLSVAQIASLVSKGGWPGLASSSVKASLEVLRSYVEVLAQEDLSKIDGSRRDPAKILALLQSLARNTATLVKKEVIRNDIAQFNSFQVDAGTVGEYLKLLKRVFVLREIPPWDPPLKSTVRLRSSPKRMLADPSLAVAALKATPPALKEDLKLLGNLFESLVLRDLSVYAANNRAELYHYHDNSDLEVDAVIQGENGAWGGIEIKLGYIGEEQAADNLKRLIKKLSETDQKPPAFLAVVIGVGGVLKKRDDGIWVIPVDCLGA